MTYIITNQTHNGDNTMNEHVHPTFKAILAGFDPKAKDMSALLPTVDQFDPLAMADRFKTEQSEPTTHEKVMQYLMEQLEDWKPIKIAGIDAKSSIFVMLDYVQKWASKEYTDDDLIEMLKIRLTNKAKDLGKAEAKHV